MTATDTDRNLTPEELAAIERKFDPETAYRNTGPIMGGLIFALLVAMSVYHFYAAGFALIRELLHFGIHLAFVLGLGFLLFSWRRAPDDASYPGRVVHLRRRQYPRYRLRCPRRRGRALFAPPAARTRVAAGGQPRRVRDLHGHRAPADLRWRWRAAPSVRPCRSSHCASWPTRSTVRSFPARSSMAGQAGWGSSTTST